MSHCLKTWRSLNPEQQNDGTDRLEDFPPLLYPGDETYVEWAEYQETASIVETASMTLTLRQRIWNLNNSAAATASEAAMAHFSRLYDVYLYLRRG